MYFQRGWSMEHILVWLDLIFIVSMNLKNKCFFDLLILNTV